MASEEHEPVMGVWASGEGSGAKSPEAENLLTFAHPMESAN